MIPLNSVALLSLLTFLADALPSRRNELSYPSLKSATEANRLDGGTVRFLPFSASRAQCNATASRCDQKEAPQVMAYYPDWVGQSFPPEKIDFSKLDWIDFAFALPSADSHLTWDDSGATNLLDRLTRRAHSYGKKVKLSIGGWTGSTFFSTVLSSQKARQILIQDILYLYKRYSLDGIDIDWEYPGRSGNRGNRVSPDDSANLLLFLHALRVALPPEAKITAAVLPNTFADSSGNPSQDVSEFAKVLDWVLLMNYDVWGSSEQPGPNAPLADGCRNSTQPEANAVSGFNAWTRAGFPPSKLVLGLPSYGYISRSSAHTLHGRTTTSEVEVASEDGGVDAGQVQFRSLLQQGALERSPTGRFVGGAGFVRHWDGCSGTPYLRSTAARQVVTYDDPDSLRLKATFARRIGMKGVNMFDAHGDTDDAALVNAVREGLGL